MRWLIWSYNHRVTRTIPTMVWMHLFNRTWKYSLVGWKIYFSTFSKYPILADTWFHLTSHRTCFHACMSEHIFARSIHVRQARRCPFIIVISTRRWCKNIVLWRVYWIWWTGGRWVPIMITVWPGGHFPFSIIDLIWCPVEWYASLDR